ncbi:MAG: hypothetical protein P4L55_13610 [Syntrophobacteraceae bacterium]|nr:hypothetical protein [Syntrophobacteraceae bacterium]
MCAKRTRKRSGVWKEISLRDIDTSKYLLLPNTSGARDANEAVRLARLPQGWPRTI